MTQEGKAFPDIALWESLADELGVSITELFACERNTDNVQNVMSEEILKTGIIKASDEIDRRKRKYRVIFAILFAIVLIILGSYGIRAFREKYTVYAISMDATILEVHDDYWKVQGEIADPKGRNGIYYVTLQDEWYYADPIGGEEGDMIRIFYQEDWRNRTLEEETYLQAIFAVEETGE